MANRILPMAFLIPGLVGLIGMLAICSSTRAQPPTKTLSAPAIKKTIRQLKPIHQPLGKPKPGEWLSRHNEPGQTFAEYVRIRPNVLTPKRNKLYVQPIGEFTDTQTRLIKLSAEFLAIFYNCEVKTLTPKNESEIPDSAKRKHPTWGDRQLLTTYILEKVLAPELPDDAFATIAFTSSDLWPGDGWNFVFGYAAFRDRVGVWSLHRLGNPDENEAAFKQTLFRTIKIATHETGHMFSIEHCTQYECGMQGSNSMAESDDQPLHLCPQCHAKVVYATGCDPVKRFEKLITFCRTHELTDELKYFELAKTKLEKTSPRKLDGNGIREDDKEQSKIRRP